MQRQTAARVNVAQASAGPRGVMPSTGSRQLVLEAQWPFPLPIHLLRVLLPRRWAQGGGAEPQEPLSSRKALRMPFVFQDHI